MKTFHLVYLYLAEFNLGSLVLTYLRIFFPVEILFKHISSYHSCELIFLLLLERRLDFKNSIHGDKSIYKTYRHMFCVRIYIYLYHFTFENRLLLKQKAHCHVEALPQRMYHFILTQHLPTHC